MKFRWWLLLCTLSVLAMPTTGWAEPKQPESEQTSAARERFEAGAKAYEQGRYREAIELFKEADALAPSAPLSFNIARAYEKMNDGRGALAWYRDYLRRDATGVRSDQVAARIRQLELELERMGVQQVTILSDPVGATVVIDGSARGVTPYTTELPPGEHQLTLEKDGFQKTERTFDLAAHKSLDVRVHLVADNEANQAAASPTAPTAQPTPTESTSPASSTVPASPEDVSSRARVSWWTWTAFGVSAVLLGTAGAVELSRRSLEKDVKDEPEQLAYDRKFNKLKSRQTTARIFLGSGVAVAAVGGVLLYFDLSRGPRHEVALSCAPDRCGLTARGMW